MTYTMAQKVVKAIIYHLCRPISALIVYHLHLFVGGPLCKDIGFAMIGNMLIPN